MGTGYSYSSLTKRRLFCVALAIIVACTALRLRSVSYTHLTLPTILLV